MQLDLAEAQTSDTALMTGICVIGGGATGISLVRRLLSAGHKVVLLESGGVDYEASLANLNAGECWGEDYYKLERARLRFFGGTTAIWGGRCAELDPIDFEARDYVPHSGWPIAWQDLQPYYGMAREQLQLRPHVPTTEEMIGSGVPLPAFDADMLRTRVWQFDSKFDRFTFDASADIIKHPECHVLTHATVTRLNADPSGRQTEYRAFESDLFRFRF